MRPVCGSNTETLKKEDTTSPPRLMWLCVMTLFGSPIAKPVTSCVNIAASVPLFRAKKAARLRVA